VAVDEVVVKCALTKPGKALQKAFPRPRASVRTLVIAQREMSFREGTWFDFHDHLGDHDVCDRVWKRLPNLRKLVVRSGWDIWERIEHATIEEIVIEEGVPFCTLRGHARPWKVPKLHSVTWHYSADCTGTGATTTAEDFRPLWEARARSLRNVDLSRANLCVRPNEVPFLDDEGFGCLLPRLAVLRLPRRAVGHTPEEVDAALEKHAPRLAHLRRFDLT
jgi:hypothetical protein